MIGRILFDGAAVDLQMMLFSLYLDTATLWLSGESSESLSGVGADKAKAFIHSFAYSLGVGGFRMALSPLRFLHYSSNWGEWNRANQAFIKKYVDLAVARQHISATTYHTQEKDGEAGTAAAKKNPALLDAMAEQSSDTAECSMPGVYCRARDPRVPDQQPFSGFWHDIRRYGSNYARKR